MLNKDIFLDRTEAQLEEWKADIKKLEAQAEAYRVDAKREYNQRLSNLIVKQKEAEKRLQEFKLASNENEKELMANLDEAITALQQSLGHIKQTIENVSVKPKDNKT